MTAENGNGRVSVREVYDLIAPLEQRIRRVEQGVIALLVLSGGQIAAALNGTSLPALIVQVLTAF